jgi:nucleotidyltransferase/DNA polymerase involved in DNA repair
MTSPSRVACVRIPRFPIAAAWLAAPRDEDDRDPNTAHWDTQPIVLVRGTLIRTVTAQAARHGIRSGMTLPQARALCAALIAWPWDEVTLAREVVRASATFLRASPQVTPLREAPGTWWVGAQGFDGIGGERHLATLLLRLARAWHPDARVAIADSCIAAQSATWSTRAHREPVHIAPGEDAVYLMRVPLALLPMDGELRDTLRALGLRTAGEVAALDPLDVERRWGAEGLALWRLARADDPRRATLATLDDPRRVTHDLPDSVTTMEPILFVVRAALDRLVRTLAAEGRAAAAIAITLTMSGTRPRRITREVRPATPLARVGPLFERCRALLDTWSLDAPVDAVEVCVAHAVTATAEQGDLLTPAWRDAAAADAALARLRTTLGPDAVVRPVRRDSHAPERAGAWDVIETFTPPPPIDTIMASHQGRALRLLTTPETIQVATDAHGAPVELRWRGTRHRLTQVQGPERLSGEWWHAAPFAREYWRGTSEVAGESLVIYREAGGWRVQGWED